MARFEKVFTSVFSNSRASARELGAMLTAAVGMLGAGDGLRAFEAG